MLHKPLIILLLLITVFISSCNNNEPPNEAADIFIALPTPPVKVKNTSGTWLVYELHIKGPTVQKVEISNNNTLQLSYTDFLDRDDLHLASIWLPYPPQGWEKEDWFINFTIKMLMVMKNNTVSI